MTISTHEEARDAVLDRFKAVWDAQAPAVNGGVAPAVEWPNVPLEDGARPLSEGNEPWARVTVRHNTGEQRSLGEAPNRRFRRMGVVIVQVFVPAGKRGLVTGDRLGNVALSAFEGVLTEDVWFLNAALVEVGLTGNWHQTNVSADFEYDVIK